MNSSLVVDESKLNRPVPVDLRTGAEVAAVHHSKTEQVALYAACAKSAAHEVTTLTGERDTATKACNALSKVGTVPVDVATKLGKLQERVERAVRDEDMHRRIWDAKKRELERWLGEGSPTNASLLENDSLLDRALDACRRVF